MNNDPRNPLLDDKRPVAVSVSAACETLQDWLASAQPPVREGPIEECVAVFNTGGGATSFLAAAPAEATLLHLDPSSSSAAGGWTATQVRVRDTRRGPDSWPRGAIRRVSAFGGRQPFALVQFEEKTDAAAKRTYIEPMALDPSTGQWCSWRLPGDLPSLLLGASETETYLDAKRGAMLYTKASDTSADEDVFALVFHNGEEWQAAQAHFPVRPGKPSTFRLLANGVTFGTLLRLGDGNAVDFMRLQLVTPNDEDPYFEHPREWQRRELREFGGGNLNAARLIPLPERPGALLLHAADGHVWLVTEFESAAPRVTRLTGKKDSAGPAVQIRAAFDVKPPAGGPPQVVLFLVEATAERRVWVARETDGAFGEWVPLGEQVRALAMPPRLEHGTEFFLVADGKSTTVERRVLDSNGEAWHPSIIETTRPPAAEPTETTTHTARLTLQTESGAAAPRAVAAIETSYPCVAVIHGIARHLAPGAPFSTVADDAGELLVRVPANGIDAPTLTVHLAKGARVEVSMDESTARRMAGTEQSHALDEARLERVHLFPPNTTPDGQRQLAEMVRKAGNQIGLRRTAEGRRILAESEPSWFAGSLDSVTMQWSIRGGAGTLPDELAAMAVDDSVSTIQSGAPHVQWGFIGDVFNWINRTRQQVTDWWVKFSASAAEFLLTVGGKSFRILANFAEGVARGVETIFNGILAAAGKAIEAGKALLEAVRSVLDVEAIQRTNKGMRLCLDGGLALTAALLRSKEIRKPLDGIVDTVVSGLDAPLGAIQQHIAGIKLGALAENGIPDKQNGGSGVPGRMALLQKGSVQARWFADRLAASGSSIQAVFEQQTLAVDDELRAKLQQLAELIKSDDPNRRTLLKLFLDREKAISDCFSEKVISGTALVELIALLRDIVKLGGEILKQTMAIVFELLAQAVDMLRTLLATTVSIPGLDSVAKMILGGAMRLSDLLTMTIAVPTTVLWKIIKLGKEEPFPQATLDALTDLMKHWGLSADADSADTDSATVNPLSELIEELFAYFHWQVAKLSKQREPEVEKLVKRMAQWARPVADKVAPVAVVVSFGLSISSVLIEKPILTLADTADALTTYGAGAKTLGKVGTLFTVVSLLAAVVGVWTKAVQNATIEFLPDTPEGKKWKQQREYVEPLDWAALSWMVSVVLTIVNLIALSAVSMPAGAWVSVGCTLLLGIILIIGFAIYTDRFIKMNEGKIQGWRIAKEIGTLIGTVPKLVKALPGIINVTLTISQGFSALMLPPYVFVGTTCNLVAKITSTGSLIDEQMARQWSDFK